MSTRRVGSPVQRKMIEHFAELSSVPFDRPVPLSRPLRFSTAWNRFDGVTTILKRNSEDESSVKKSVFFLWNGQCKQVYVTCTYFGGQFWCVCKFSWSIWSWCLLSLFALHEVNVKKIWLFLRYSTYDVNSIRKKNH